MPREERKVKKNKKLRVEHERLETYTSTKTKSNDTSLAEILRAFSEILVGCQDHAAEGIRSTAYKS